jgi:hypothetical protein
MFTSALKVLHAQWQYVKGNIPYEQSYKLGEKAWARYYSIQAAKETLAHFRRLAWKQASRSARLPLQYGLMKAKETGLKARGFIGYWLNGAWQRLARLPVGRVKFGGLRQVRPIGRSSGCGTSRSVSGYYMERFLNSHAGDIQGCVLEIGRHNYAQQFTGYNYSKATETEIISLTKSAITTLADLSELNNQPTNGFDCIIAPHVLHQICNLKATAQKLYELLKPGGVLLATFPGISLNQWADTSYWAFTNRLAQKLFAEIFPSANVTIHSYGNVLVTTALLHGLAASELQEKELAYQDPHYQILITLKATKPLPGKSFHQ